MNATDAEVVQQLLQLQDVVNQSAQALGDVREIYTSIQEEKAWQAELKSVASEALAIRRQVRDLVDEALGFKRECADYSRDVHQTLEAVISLLNSSGEALQSFEKAVVAYGGRDAFARLQEDLRQTSTTCQEVDGKLRHIEGEIDSLLARAEAKVTALTAQSEEQSLRAEQHAQRADASATRASAILTEVSQQGQKVEELVNRAEGKLTESASDCTTAKAQVVKQAEEVTIILEKVRQAEERIAGMVKTAQEGHHAVQKAVEKIKPLGEADRRLQSLEKVLEGIREDSTGRLSQLTQRLSKFEDTVIPFINKLNTRLRAVETPATERSGHGPKKRPSTAEEMPDGHPRPPRQVKASRTNPVARQEEVDTTPGNGVEQGSGSQSVWVYVSLAMAGFSLLLSLIRLFR